MTSRAIVARFVDTNGCARVVAWEYARRSLINVRMRAAALSMRSRYRPASP